MPPHPTLFRKELASARRLLAKTPHAGTHFGTFDGREIYRLNLSGTRRHLHYYVDETAQIVSIVAVWDAATKRHRTSATFSCFLPTERG